MFFRIYNLFIVPLKSGLLKQSVVYGISSSIASLVGILLLPILTRFLSPYDFGIIETFKVIVLLLAGIIGMGGNTLLARKFFALQLPERRKYISNILNLICLDCFIIFVLVLFFSNFLSNWVKLSQFWLLVAVLVAFFKMFITIALTLYQLEKKVGKYAIFTNLNTLLNIAISLLLILVIGLKWEGRLLGITISSFLFFAVAIIIFRKRKIKLKISPKLLLSSFLLGFPLVISHISGWANNMVDKLMVNNLIDIESTGLYAVGYKFGAIVMMIEVAFSKAWLPFFYKKIESGKMKDKLKIVKVTYFYSLILLIFALLLGIFGKNLLFFMVDENFYTAHKFIFLIALAYCFDGIRKLFQGYLIHLGKTKIFSLIIVFSACINIILNYVLLKRIRWVSGFLKCLHGKNRRGMCVINLCRFDATI